MVENKKLDSDPVINQLGTQRYMYRSADEALEIYSLLSDQTKAQMAQVYKQAFGGPPWFERFSCNACNNFSPTADCCPSCKGTSLREAYPTEELIKEEFPAMMSEFVPGVLITAKDLTGEIIGFTTGGIISLSQLVKKKYKGSEEILQSMMETCNISADEVAFYNNETCIRPGLQNKGVGTRLNLERLQAAVQIEAPNICGRTINLPWLNVIGKQTTGAGYTFIPFTPTGDRYTVDGVTRRFYWGARVKS